MGSAAFMNDTGILAYGRDSGLGQQDEGGTFGTVADRNGDLPSNSRFVNEAATMVNVAAGIEKDNWLA